MKSSPELGNTETNKKKHIDAIFKIRMSNFLAKETEESVQNLI